MTESLSNVTKTRSLCEIDGAIAPEKPFQIPLPPNEDERLQALRRYHILDTPPEAAFDRITALAARLFQVPIALVSLVDESRGWFKSCYGFDLREVQRDATICSLALLTDEVLVIPDTRRDERLACNPFVQSEPGLRFYAGAPLLTQDGFNLGTLCLLDLSARDPLTADQKATLVDLAAMVMDELELRLAAHKVARIDAALLEVTQEVAAVTGTAFFHALVPHLARVLGVDYTYIGLLRGDAEESIETIATCAKGQIVENFIYCLQDTPCQEVLQQRKLCCYPRQVRTLFPRAPLLEPLGIESYVAVPFFDSAGHLLGLLGVMDSAPLENVYLAESLLTIFAMRISTELERQRTEEIRTQTLLWEQHYSCQLQGLTQAALDINSALSIEAVLDMITEQAYKIIGTHQAVTSMTLDQNWSQAISAIYLSDKYAQWRDYDEKPDGSGIYACICHLNRPLRMTQAELEAHPRWRGFGAAVDRHPPMRGWLAAPLVGRDGRNMGLIQLSDKYEGEFTENDEAMLVQLAQMASVAIENTRLYEAERLARSEAEAANRIKDEFLAVLSHELRSPLNPILGWTKLLRTRSFDAQATERALETIERNAKLQSQLIEDLLDVSRILRGKLTLHTSAVNLETVVEAALETVRLAAEAKQIQIQTRCQPGLGRVMGDAARLQQVVWNLLSNAVKFTPVGGRVEVTLEWERPSLLLLTVSDTGKGIAPEFLPHVFEYFRQEDGRTTRKFGGLGLGLAIARQLVELHGGTVAARSAGENQGASFTVRLPLMSGFELPPSTQESMSPDETALLPLRQVRILLVDDQTDMRDLMLTVLEAVGAEVKAVASAVEALEVLRQAPVDLLISDIGMPEMDGYMLMRELQQFDQMGALPQKLPPAIALTAYAGEADQKQAIASGFQLHLSKPIAPEELIEAIARLLSPAPPSEQPR